METHPLPDRWYDGAALKERARAGGLDDERFLAFLNEMGRLCDDATHCDSKLASVLLHAVVEAVEGRHVLRAYYLLFVHESPFVSMPLQALSRTILRIVSASLVRSACGRVHAAS